MFCIKKIPTNYTIFYLILSRKEYLFVIQKSTQTAVIVIWSVTKHNNAPNLKMYEHFFIHETCVFSTCVFSKDITLDLLMNYRVLDQLSIGKSLSFMYRQQRKKNIFIIKTFKK